MTPGTEATSERVRPLVPGDLERVIEIDRQHAGRSRRGFYEKRLAAALRHPQAFVALGYADGARVDGFALAHILDGEFGGRFPVAMLDAIGVAREMGHRGIGHALLERLDAALRQRGARELRTEAPWASHGLLRLFAAAGFTLAPRTILERPSAGAPPF